MINHRYSHRKVRDAHFIGVYLYYHPSESPQLAQVSYALAFRLFAFGYRLSAIFGCGSAALGSSVVEESCFGL
jgi:hypothetical protein